MSECEECNALRLVVHQRKAVAEATLAELNAKATTADSHFYSRLRRRAHTAGLRETNARQALDQHLHQHLGIEDG